MHVDRTDQIKMPRVPAGFAGPLPVFRLMFMPTYGTLATCSSFGASEALDLGLFAFMGEIINVTTVLPQAHTLIVVASSVPISHTVGIANKEGPNFLFNAKIDHFAGSLMALITNTTFDSSRLLVFGTLQLFPATGMLRTPGLILANDTQGFGPLTLQRTNSTPRHDEGFTGVGRHTGKMDFTQVHSGMHLARGLLGQWNLHTHMQFIAIVPDKRHRTTVLWQCNGKHQRVTPTSHRQDHPLSFFAHGLCRPEDGIELLFFVGIAHLHFGMR